MTDLLDPSALLHVLPQLLPTTSSSFEPQLRSPSDALAALIHTILTRLDFRLTGLAEDDRLPPSVTATTDSDSTPTSTSSNKLPAEWNAKGPDHYSFRYKHHQSSLDYLVKIVKLGNKAVIHGIALQGSKTSTLELPLGDYFSSSFWPYPSQGGGGGGEQEPLVNGFIASSRVKDLVIAFKSQVLQTLVPGLRKEGYTEESNSNTETGGSSSSTQPGRSQQPPPRAPFRGDEDDPSTPSYQQPPFRNPLIIGDRDLDPLGGSPLALPPRFGGGGSSAPPPLFPGGDTGGGMFVGPNHPMFRNRFPPNNQGLPPGAVPPGARFDPIYPSGAGPGGIGGSGRFDPFNPDNPDVGGARPQNIGEPDWDELAPPRGENAFGGANRGGFGGFGGRGGRGGPRGNPDTGGWYS
ncbi:uncharacterized protein UTRI_04156_B [Ustilago trichophora]|uniref:Uncharacterized protein n=1 Tax=Ustilago trichophora TaxID=86804 RepID=A0A5C3E7Y3_9BASI|nr:uncharacterized protein UTRI_04156_B [Ustilago trichophora]